MVLFPGQIPHQWSFSRSVYPVCWGDGHSHVSRPEIKYKMTRLPGSFSRPAVCVCCCCCCLCCQTTPLILNTKEQMETDGQLVFVWPHLGQTECAVCHLIICKHWELQPMSLLLLAFRPLNIKVTICTLCRFCCLRCNAFFSVQNQETQLLYIVEKAN